MMLVSYLHLSTNIKYDITMFVSHFGPSGLQVNASLCICALRVEGLKPELRGTLLV